MEAVDPRTVKVRTVGEKTPRSQCACGVDREPTPTTPPCSEPPGRNELPVGLGAVQGLTCALNQMRLPAVVRVSWARDGLDATILAQLLLFVTVVVASPLSQTGVTTKGHPCPRTPPAQPQRTAGHRSRQPAAVRSPALSAGLTT
ncbi:hypothetical protein NK798_34735 [Streptomyces sp. TRM75561]|nr:hypothetical protein [Streptomyces sp. TRM75561]MDH3039330.1 hypothetical protein [Streptomyces sp. TRM75561]